ncbi:hypothetical protein BGZ63DRAFT_428780 [Mariannaea sp. PMI_226]|nr:hypothetical protein BGZ63DRAFT_428780 [Mariannaea sp. PMI_226]
MKVAILSGLSALIASAVAADCTGPQNSGISSFGDAYWDARNKMCGNIDCAYQQECTTHGSKTIATIGFKGTVTASITRKHTGGTKGFSNCWDATADIINQCVYKEQRLSGVWTYNGQQYIVDTKYSL